MIKRITLSHILVFLILSSAVDAQSSLPPPVAPSPNATLPNRVPYLDPMVVVLVCVFFLVGCFAVFLHHWSNILLSQSATTANFHSTRPQGIDPQLLNTFPILPCSAVKQLKFDSAAAPECAVCLAEYDHHDQLRLLPKCHHAFHSECIDAWLASHVTCPVCRARLKPVEEERHHRSGNDVVIVIPS